MGVGTRESGRSKTDWTISVLLSGLWSRKPRWWNTYLTTRLLLDVRMTVYEYPKSEVNGGEGHSGSS